MTRAEWEAPLHVYLDALEARPAPSWVDTEEARLDRARRDAYGKGQNGLEAAVREAHLVGYVAGMRDVVESLRWAAFRAQAYGVSLEAVLGL